MSSIALGLNNRRSYDYSSLECLVAIFVAFILIRQNLRYVKNSPAVKKTVKEMQEICRNTRKDPSRYNAMRKIWDGRAGKWDWDRLPADLPIGSQALTLGFIAIDWGVRAAEVRGFQTARRPLTAILLIIWETFTDSQWSVNHTLKQYREGQQKKLLKKNIVTPQTT
jgi:hypothetical protein